LDEALKDLEMGEGNEFVYFRGSLLDAQGEIRKDIFKPRGDIHLNAAGTQIVSLRIQRMLEVMLPNLVPVQTPPAPVQTPTAKPQRTRVQAPVQDPVPVAVNTPPAVGAPLVAEVVNAPVVVQHVVVVDQAQVETPMEVEDEDAVLQRLFFKKYGRALPEPEKEKESDVDKINFVIDLTDDTEEMEDDTTPPLVPIPVVKSEPIEAVEAPEIVANVVKVAEATKQRRASRRLEIIEMAKARKAITAFGQSLRKSEVIPEKEAPLAAGNVIADTDSDMSEDRTVTNVNNESGNNVIEPLTTDEAIEMAEAAIAESDAEIAATQKVIDEFDD
jgi:hypothetical protein